MIFHSRGKLIPPDLKLCISGETILRVTHTKFLGVMIDDRLNWETHIKYIKGKIAKGLGVICKARKVLDKSCLCTLYYSFLYPYLNYCIEVWGKAASCYIDSLKTIQKRCIRIISNAKFRDHTAPLFKALNILCLDHIYTHKVALFMFKLYHDKLPKVFNSMFTVNENNTRQNGQLVIPLAKLECFRRTVRIQGVHIWNNYCKIIDIKCSIHAFGKELRKYFFRDLNFLKHSCL